MESHLYTGNLVKTQLRELLYVYMSLVGFYKPYNTCNTKTLTSFI